MKQVGSILCLICAGFFLFCIEATLAVRVPEAGMSAHLIVPLVFGVPFLVCLIPGLALQSFRHWVWTTGMVLLITTGWLAFTALSFVCMLHSQMMQTIETPEQFAKFQESFSDWPLLAIVAPVITLIGAIMVYFGRRSDETP